MTAVTLHCFSVETSFPVGHFCVVGAHGRRDSGQLKGAGKI